MIVASVVPVAGNSHVCLWALVLGNSLYYVICMGEASDHNLYIPNGLFLDKVRPIMDAELMQWKVSSTFHCSKFSSNLYAKKQKALGM